MQISIVVIAFTPCAVSYGWHVKTSAPVQSDQFVENQVSRKEKSELQGSDEMSMLQVKGGHKQSKDNNVAYIKMGDGLCRTSFALEWGNQPRSYTKEATWSEDSCKSHCSAFKWCEGIAVNESYCALYIAAGQNPNTPNGWHFNHNDCLGYFPALCTSPITYARAGGSNHCYRKAAPLTSQAADPCSTKSLGGKPEWHTCEKECIKDDDCGKMTCEAGKCKSSWGGWCADEKTKVCQYQPIIDANDPCSVVFEKADWRMCEAKSCASPDDGDCPSGGIFGLLGYGSVCKRSIGKCVPEPDLRYDLQAPLWCADRGGEGNCVLQVRGDPGYG